MLLKPGLVLEGGGMRGAYTAGVLEAFLENNIEFPYVIGVSAGACNAASYLSKQKGRNRKVNIGFVKDPRYLSFRNYFRNRELFGMDYVFDEIPKKIVPFDFEAFHRNNAEFVIGTTDCYTGKPVYLKRNDYKEDVLMAIRASSSLPFAAPVIDFLGHQLMDGGISDSIPIKKAKEDGYKKNVVILTRNRGYQKKPSKFQYFIKRKYHQYEGLCKALENRWLHYNETTEFLHSEEQNNHAFIICPKEPIKVSRIERNPLRLSQLFDQGYKDGEASIEQIEKWTSSH
jgi:predicted patatin/cPLA2 family phospholipase